MRCVCGYENRDGELDDDYKSIKDPGEKFIKIIGALFVIQKDEYYGEEHVHLYACPVCNTVQMKQVD